MHNASGLNGILSFLRRRNDLRHLRTHKQIRDLSVHARQTHLITYWPTQQCSGTTVAVFLHHTEISTVGH